LDDKGKPPPIFALFNEIGIINQLAAALFEARLPPGVLVSHFSVLNHLIRVRDGATPLQLATAFQVPKTTMTHTLAGLEKRGWVDLRPNPRDKRSKQVWLTDAGRAFRDNAIGDLAPDLRRIASDLPGLAEDLLPRLAELRSYMDRARAGDDD
jgi:DNA-binding MarR family transcriptional regulator